MACGGKPARRSCCAVPYRICRAGLTALQPTRVRNARAGSAAAASSATHAPWLKPHNPAGTGPISVVSTSRAWLRSSACSR